MSGDDEASSQEAARNAGDDEDSLQEAATLAAASVAARSGGDLGRALSCAERCHELRVASHGEQHAEVAAALGLIGAARRRRGELDEQCNDGHACTKDVCDVASGQCRRTADVAAAGTQCRRVSNVVSCDLPEFCTGDSAECPDDAQGCLDADNDPDNFAVIVVPTTAS